MGAVPIWRPRRSAMGAETWCPGDYWTSGVVHDPPEDIRYAADNSAIGYATGKLPPIDTTHWSTQKDGAPPSTCRGGPRASRSTW